MLAADAVAVKPSIVRATIPAVGTLVANESVQITGELSRRLVKVFVKEGAEVKKGDILFKLDDADLQAELARLRIRRKLAEGIATRQQKLLEGGLLSQENFDRGSADVNLIDAEMTVLSVNLAKTQIRAPFSGKVGLRRASEGAWITPSTPIITLQDTSKIKIDFPLPERYAAAVTVGQKFSFRTAGIDEAFEGTVVVLEPQIDTTTRSLLVRGHTDNPHGKLVPGSFASIDVPLKETADGILIPARAIIPSMGGHGVFVARGDIAQFRQVEIGLRTDTDVQILSGLAPGDIVLLSNLLRIRDGSPVKVQLVDPPAPKPSPPPASSGLSGRDGGPALGSDP
jgi:membrane fusion protein (multidrug efflux system)